MKQRDTCVSDLEMSRIKNGLGQMAALLCLATMSLKSRSMAFAVLRVSVTWVQHSRRKFRLS